MRTIPRIDLMVVMLLLTGCGGGAYQKLCDVGDCPEFASLTAAGKGLPEATVCVALPNSHGEQMHIAVHETTGDRHDVVFVMVHGVMSDYRCWRFMRPLLAEKGDVLAVDLPGCGESDRLDPRRNADADYTPVAMARVVF